VPFPILGGDLGEDGSSHKVRAVCFDAEGLGGVRGDEDGGHCDMFLIVCQLGVPFEGFGELLGNHRGHPDMFGFQKESGGPNLIAFFELFLWGTLRIWLGFVVLIIHILHKGWKWAGATGINLLGILLLSLPLIPPFHPTTYTTLR
jgi:hypothetical protein